MDDYVESIRFRPYARSQVITQRCEDLEEAFEEAELAERAEINKTTSRSTATVMTTLFNNNSFYRENVHPFRKFGSINLNSCHYSLNHNRNSRNDPAKKCQKITRYFPSHNKNYIENESNIEERRKKRLCFKCGEVGYMQFNCPNRIKPKNFKMINKIPNEDPSSSATYISTSSSVRRI